MTRDKFSPSVLLLPAILGGAFGALLRRLMLMGHPWAYPALCALSAVVIAILALSAVCLCKNSSMEATLTRQPIVKGFLPPSIVMVLGAALWGVSAIMGLLSYTDVFDAVAGALGLIAAACLGVQALLRREGKSSSAAGMVITLALVVDLISRFRHWSSDPRIADYCFQLFACLFSMLAAFHLAGFPLKLGKRRTAIFTALGAGFFCLICLVDNGTDSKLHYAGLALWLLGGACSLRKAELPTVQPEVPVATEAADTAEATIASEPTEAAQAPETEEAP